MAYKFYRFFAKSDLYNVENFRKIWEFFIRCWKFQSQSIPPFFFIVKLFIFSHFFYRVKKCLKSVIFSFLIGHFAIIIFLHFFWIFSINFCCSEWFCATAEGAHWSPWSAAEGWRAVPATQQPSTDKAHDGNRWGQGTLTFEKIYVPLVKGREYTYHWSRGHV